MGSMNLYLFRPVYLPECIFFPSSRNDRFVSHRMSHWIRRLFRFLDFAASVKNYTILRSHFRESEFPIFFVLPTFSVRLMSEVGNNPSESFNHLQRSNLSGICTRRTCELSISITSQPEYQHPVLLVASFLNSSRC